MARAKSFTYALCSFTYALCSFTYALCSFTYALCSFTYALCSFTYALCSFTYALCSFILKAVRFLSREPDAKFLFLFYFNRILFVTLLRSWLDFLDDQSKELNVICRVSTPSDIFKLYSVLLDASDRPERGCSFHLNLGGKWYCDLIFLNDR